MKKRLLVGLIVFLCTIFVVTLIAKPFIDEKPKVIVLIKDSKSAYWKMIKAGAEKGLKDFGLEGQVVAPTDSLHEAQVEVLGDVMKENPDVLIISPIYPEAMIPYLEEVVAEWNVPVLLLDTDALLENKISYVGTDNVALGERAGALLGSQLQPGNEVAIIGFDSISPVANERIQGAKKSLEAIRINVVSEGVEVSFEPVQVQEAVKAILKDYPNLKGIIATNDGLAIDAVEVLQEEGIAIPVIGADGINDMIELIEEGTLPGTVAQNPYDMGYISVEAAKKVIEGVQVDPMIDSGVDIIVKGNAKNRLDFQRKLLR
ncbi:sugar ABC transporter substrate-binding protein [Halalkalibacter kiskunsagensis]|uniref:Sugar ABC transporter substrate-binding protein n=1 Tax=Halalkalibacter kiskunsagensis TaxID=1548599 RepID=A0ABV6K8R0_9BACI